MKTVKMFYKDKKGIFVQKGKEKFYFKIGKEYEIPKEEAIKTRIFNASANCDISEITSIFSFRDNSVFGIVNINKIGEEMDGEIIGNRIKVLKLLSFDECIKYDKTGRWCCFMAITGEGDFKKLQEAIIKKDEDGYFCYQLLRWFKDDKELNKERLIEEIIKKDKTGELCFRLIGYGVDIKRVQEEVIKKDITGALCYRLAFYKGTDDKKLFEAVMKKDLYGWWVERFAKDIIGTDERKKNKIFDKIKKCK